MASPNKNPEYQAKLPRYGHDLSHDFGFTASTGMLLPVFADILNPGEKVQGGCDVFTQLQVPMAVPAQVDMEQIIDYFFVPMPMLYQPFESLIYQTNDYLSTAAMYFRGNEPNVHSTREPYEYFPALVLYNPSTPSALPTWVNTFHSFVNSYNWYYFDSSLPNKTCYEAIGRQAYRLLDMCGFNPDELVAPWTDTGSGHTFSPLSNFNPNVFPYQLLAYQCVYQYFYRVDQWDRFDNETFNWDEFISNLPSLGLFSIKQLKCLQLRYRPKYLDYFTNVKPSPYLQGQNMLRNLTGADNSANVLVEFEKWLDGTSDYLRNKNAGGTSPASSISKSTQIASGIFNQGGVISPAYLSGSQTLRNLRAADKFLQITARAANRYDDQVLAHLGYKVPNDVKHNIKYLGTQRKPFKINTVVSTDGNTLGDRAGYALGSVSGKGFDYTAPCHGVFIAIYSCMVKPRYISGFERNNVIRSIHDFWQPEFDNLGMQPIFAYELERMQVQPDYASLISGWQWRYEEKKRRFSKVSSAFRKYLPWSTYVDSSGDTHIVAPSSASTNPLTAYFNITQPNYKPYAYNGLSVRDQTIGNDFRIDMNGTVENNFPFAFDWDSVLIPPTQLNNVLAMSYDDAWHTEQFAKNPALMYQTDPFIVDMHINFKKVSAMSVHSMPSIGD